MNMVTLNNKQLGEMLAQLMRTDPGMPVEFAAEDNRAIGMFVPYFISQRKKPPAVSPEQQAEFERRLGTIDDSVTHEEMVRMVMEDLRSTTPES